jgi:hypothetical protein
LPRCRDKTCGDAGGDAPAGTSDADVRRLRRTNTLRVVTPRGDVSGVVSSSSGGVDATLGGAEIASELPWCGARRRRRRRATCSSDVEWRDLRDDDDLLRGGRGGDGGGGERQ